MLTRRGFAGFASCAICAATGFIATEAWAQGTQPPAMAAGIKPRTLSQIDGPMPGYVTIYGDRNRSRYFNSEAYPSGGRIILHTRRRI
jgi:hypothetical protein